MTQRLFCILITQSLMADSTLRIRVVHSQQTWMRGNAASAAESIHERLQVRSAPRKEAGFPTVNHACLTLLSLKPPTIWSEIYEPLV